MSVALFGLIMYAICDVTIIRWKEIFNIIIKHLQITWIRKVNMSKTNILQKYTAGVKHFRFLCVDIKHVQKYICMLSKQLMMISSDKHLLCLPHSPTCFTLVFSRALQDATRSWQWLEYVFPSVAHTGSVFCLQIVGHWHNALPSGLLMQWAPQAQNVFSHGSVEIIAIN